MADSPSWRYACISTPVEYCWLLPGSLSLPLIFISLNLFCCPQEIHPIISLSPMNQWQSNSVAVPDASMKTSPSLKHYGSLIGPRGPGASWDQSGTFLWLASSWLHFWVSSVSEPLTMHLQMLMEVVPPEDDPEWPAHALVPRSSYDDFIFVRVFVVTFDISVKKKKNWTQTFTAIFRTLGLEGDPDWRGDVDSCDSATSWEDRQWAVGHLFPQRQFLKITRQQDGLNWKWVKLLLWNRFLKY